MIDEIAPEEISIGDYILTGGELPAMVLIDSVVRYVDGVLSKDSTKEESFTSGILEYPQYTRPEVFKQREVPEVLKSGHHANIEKWRRMKAIKTTYQKRPDLLKNGNFTKDEIEYIKSMKENEREIGRAHV